MKYLPILNKIRKAFDTRNFEDLDRFIDTTFKDAPEDVKNRIKMAVDKAKEYAEEGKPVDILDLAEELLLILGMKESEAGEASKFLVDAVKKLADDVSNQMSK